MMRFLYKKPSKENEILNNILLIKVTMQDMLITVGREKHRETA